MNFVWFSRPRRRKRVQARPRPAACGRASPRFRLGSVIPGRRKRVQARPRPAALRRRIFDLRASQWPFSTRPRRQLTVDPPSAEPWMVVPVSARLRLRGGQSEMSGRRLLRRERSGWRGESRTEDLRPIRLRRTREVESERCLGGFGVVSPLFALRAERLDSCVSERPRPRGLARSQKLIRERSRPNGTLTPFSRPNAATDL